MTCIEALSPLNKREGTEGWKAYQRKRRAYLIGIANLLEIDLLRAGQRMPMLDPWPNCPFTMLLCRRDRGSRCRVWPAYSLRPLPIVRVPLNYPDPDVLVPLQPIVDEVYRQSRYGESIDYRKPCNPELAPEESAWLQEQFKQRAF